jgi:hypothetical protein
METNTTNIINFEIDKNAKIHFIGIGGISMSGIAIMLNKRRIQYYRFRYNRK